MNDNLKNNKTSREHKNRSTSFCGKIRIQIPMRLPHAFIQNSFPFQHIQAT